jgi:hypothetical protein
MNSVAILLTSHNTEGPADAIGKMNKTRLMQTCRSDGILLKPLHGALSLSLLHGFFHKPWILPCNENGAQMLKSLHGARF